MSEEKKKGSKSYETFYYIIMTLAVAGFGFFGYMKLTDTEIYVFDRIIGCYTICFTAALIFLAVRIFTLFKKNGKKLSYQFWLMAVAGGITAACVINSIAEDFGKSKVKGILEINETTKVFLCESTQKNGHTQIDVYRVKGRLARKLGEIDETLFSVRCIEQDMYSYAVSGDESLLTVNCQYGVYGNGMYMLSPTYDTGTLSYTFKLD